MSGFVCQVIRRKLHIMRTKESDITKEQQVQEACLDKLEFINLLQISQRLQSALRKRALDLELANMVASLQQVIAIEGEG